MYTWPGGVGPSCDRCSAHIIQAGIERIVHKKVEPDDDFAGRWAESIDRGLAMYIEAGVEVVPIYDSTEASLTMKVRPEGSSVKTGILWDEKYWTK
jgi:deoxycytidylate deaminase